MKLGPLWWRVDAKDEDRANAQTALDWADKFLHMVDPMCWQSLIGTIFWKLIVSCAQPDGMYWADENVRGLSSPGRGTETCSVVETMFSMRTAYEVTGNITFMDRLEQLAFNALPAALWPDVTANVYHHAANMVSVTGRPWAYDLYFCCTANVHQVNTLFQLTLAQCTYGDFSL